MSRGPGKVERAVERAVRRTRALGRVPVEIENVVSDAYDVPLGAKPTRAQACRHLARDAQLRSTHEAGRSGYARPDDVQPLHPQPAPETWHPSVERGNSRTDAFACQEISRARKIPSSKMSSSGISWHESNFRTSGIDTSRVTLRNACFFVNTRPAIG